MADQQVNYDNIDVDELRILLKDREVKFNGRAGAKKLLSIASEADIDDEEIPLIDDEVGLYSDIPDEPEPSDEEAEEGEEAEAKDNSNIVPKKYRDLYGSAQNCGDEVAGAMTEFTTVPAEEGKKGTKCSEARLIQVVDDNGLDEKWQRWQHLNLGMRRMNLGNSLRAMVKRGNRVQIGDRVWEAVEKPTEGEETEAAID